MGGNESEISNIDQLDGNMSLGSVFSNYDNKL